MQGEPKLYIKAEVLHYTLKDQNDLAAEVEKFSKGGSCQASNWKPDEFGKKMHKVLRMRW